MSHAETLARWGLGQCTSSVRIYTIFTCKTLEDAQEVMKQCLPTAASRKAPAKRTDWEDDQQPGPRWATDDELAA